MLSFVGSMNSNGVYLSRKTRTKVRTTGTTAMCFCFNEKRNLAALNQSKSKFNMVIYIRFLLAYDGDSIRVNDSTSLFFKHMQ